MVAESASDVYGSTTTRNNHHHRNKSSTNVNNYYSSVEKKTHTKHFLDGDPYDYQDPDARSGYDSRSGFDSRSEFSRRSEVPTEMLTLDDIPRVKSLNDEEVHSIDSAMLTGDEDFMDSSSVDSRRYSRGSLPDDPERRISPSKRENAVKAARKMSVFNQDEREKHVDRKISVNTPSTLRRNVSAFGEITVMPVGDNEDEELQITVDEEIREYLK